MKDKSMLKEVKSLTDKIFGMACKVENSEFPKLSSTQLLIMDYVLEHKDKVILQKDLEDILKLTRATVSSVLGTLERYGIIERMVDELDTRTKKIVLTPKAMSFYEYGKDKMKFIEDKVVEGISKDELDIFFKVVDKMNINIERIREC